MIPMADIKAQYAPLQDQIMETLQRVYQDCHFILGENVTALEKEIAEVCQAKYGIAVNSGTDALIISLAALGVGPGDEVITTPFTFVATIEAVVLLGATPVFVDIDPKTFNLDPELIEKKISPRTRAIMPVHLYGQCADMDAILEVANKHGIKVVADGAQAIGSTYKGKGIGRYGDLVTLSFFPTKNLGASGDGGMILTNDAELDARVRSLRFHGMDETYSYQYVGFCSRLDEVQAAVIRVKLPYLDEWNGKRRANAAKYIEAFKDTDITAPYVNPDCHHIFHQFTLRFPKRDELQAELKKAEVSSAVYYPKALHLQKAYEYLGYSHGDLPEAEKTSKEVLSIPVFPELKSEQVETVASAVVEAVQKISSESAVGAG